MPAQGLTPVGNFPPVVSDSFPQGIQFQLDGVNVGSTNISTINIVGGEALDLTVGTGDTATTLTLTIPVPNVSGT